MILIIGSKEEFHSRYVCEYLKNQGEKVKYLDTRTIPGNFISSWYAGEPVIKGSIFLEEEKVSLESIKSIYWRWHYGINVYPNSNSEDDLHTANMIHREFISYVDSLFDAVECKWVNSHNAIKMHRNKPHQLYLMAANEIKIPKTLITTDKDELLNFVENFDGEIIFKPVRGGAHTEVLKQTDLTPEKLNLIKYSPVTFQEKLKGVDVRIYGIDKEFFAAEIRTECSDFREDPKAEIVPVEIPDSVKNDCLKIMELFDLKFTGIDVKYNPDKDEYVFIEANPSPMFYHFEQKTGFPITEKLCEILIS